MADPSNPNQQLTVSSLGNHGWFNRMLLREDMLKQRFNPRNPRDQEILIKLVGLGWMPQLVTKANLKFVLSGNDKKLRKYMLSYFKTLPSKDIGVGMDPEIIQKTIRWHTECVLDIADPLWDDRVRLGPSSVAGAGQGIFATRDIRQGEIVCYYPCHTRNLHTRDGYCAWDFSVVSNQACESPMTDEEMEEMEGGNPRASVEDKYNDTLEEIKERSRHYAMSIFRSPKYDLDVYSDPAVPVQNKYLGAFLNDSGFQAGGVSADEYLARDLEHNNCQFSSPIKQSYEAYAHGNHSSPIQIFADRDIPAGGECFLSYGYGYWKHRS